MRFDRADVRASKRRVWRKYWHMRKRRGAPCDRLTRRFFRRDPGLLIRVERRAAERVVPPEPVVVCAPRREPWWLRWSVALIVGGTILCGLALGYVLIRVFGVPA